METDKKHNIRVFNKGVGDSEHEWRLQTGMGGLSVHPERPYQQVQ